MNQYKSFLLIISIFSFFTTFSQSSSTGRRVVASTLSGTITASSGQPLPGATITIHDIHRGALADSAGNYRTRSFAAGRYTVEVSYSGYRTIVQMLTVNGKTTHDFTLEPAVAEGENVTVTGVSTATSTRRSPQPVDVIRRDQLLAISSTNIINMLTHTPGVNAVTTGPAISKPFIRGLGYNRVITVNDDVRQEGQQWGDEHGIEIDDYSAQRVEVLKGPASLIYGSDALAGVVNIQTLVPAREGTLKADLLSEYQTNNRLRGFYGNIAGTTAGFSWGAYGSYKGAEDYGNKYDGRVFNSRFYNKNFGGMLGYGGTWGHSNLLITWFNQHAGIVEGDRDSATGAFLKANPDGTESIAGGDDFNTTTMTAPYQHIRHFKLTTDNAINFGRSRLDLVLGYQRNQRQEFGDATAPMQPDVWFDLQTLTYTARFNLPYTGNWKTSFGLTGMAQNNENKGEEVLIPAYDLFDAGGYVFTQYNKDKLTLSGGLRYDIRHIDSKQYVEGSELKFSAFKKNFANVTGSAGVSYLLNKAVTLKANMARGFRAPSLAELASNGAHEGTNRYEIGNNSLKSETSMQGDLGLGINSLHITFDLSGFYNHVNNFIFYQRMKNAAGGDSVLMDPDDGELQVFRFNQRTANLYGLEASLDIHPHPLDWLHFENRFSFTRARFTEAVDGSQNVPLIPAARLLSNLRGNFMPQGKKVRNFYVSIESDYTARQNHPFTGFDTETPTGDYQLINAYAGVDMLGKNGKTIFSIHLSAMNVGDVAYQNHLSRLKYSDANNVTGRTGVFNVGRNFGIKVNVPLEFNW